MCLWSPEPASTDCKLRCRRLSGHDQLSSKFLSAGREIAVSQRPEKARLQNEQLRNHCECVNPLDDACWISLISLTIDACCFDSQNPVAWSRALYRTGVKIDINHGTAKIKSRVQAENKDKKQMRCSPAPQDSNIASRRAWDSKDLLMCL